MKKIHGTIICLFSLYYLTLTTNPSIYGQQVSPYLSFYKVPDFVEGTLRILREQVELPTLPRASKWRTGSVIDENWLSNPGSITRKHLSVGRGAFKDQGWFGGVCLFSADRLVRNNEALPDKLPAGAERVVQDIISEMKRRDPNFSEEKFKERRLDAHRKSKEYIVSGSLRTRICNAPNAQAALEYLLIDACLSNMPVSAIAGRFSKSNRMEGLGTIGFCEQSDSPKKYSLILFVRDNIAVIINARGDLASEGLPLAQKIDSAIVQKPALTYQQLLARRPSITMARNAETLSEGVGGVPFYVSSPKTAKIVDVKAYVNGTLTPVEGARVKIIGKTGVVRAKVEVTTSELLTNTREVEVVVPEQTVSQD